MNDDNDNCLQIQTQTMHGNSPADEPYRPELETVHRACERVASWPNWKKRTPWYTEEPQHD